MIDNVHFEQLIDQIYPTELHLNNANSSDIESSFFDLRWHLLLMLYI